MVGCWTVSTPIDTRRFSPGRCRDGCWVLVIATATVMVTVTASIADNISTGTTTTHASKGGRKRESTTRSHNLARFVDSVCQLCM